MALATTMVWEVRTAGNAANSGGFNSVAAGTDRTQQDAPHVIVDGVTITATVHPVTLTSLILTGYTVTAADVGNTFRVAGGTATPGTYEITSVDLGSNRWICDRDVGTAGQTAEGRMGGASSDPALIAAVTVAFSIVWVRSGTYTITSATQNVAGGCINTPVGGQLWEGYQTSRGDLGTPPLLQASGISTATLFAISQNDCRLFNVDVDGATLTAIRGIDIIGRGTVAFCVARNCTNSGIRVGSALSLILNCGATGCTTAGAGFLDAGGGAVGTIYGCWARGNTITGFLTDGYVFHRCIAAGNTGATTDGFAVTSNNTGVSCVAYGNGRDGFRFTGTNGNRFVNCVAESNVGSGFNGSGGGAGHFLFNCAAFGNGTDVNGASFLQNIGFVTGTSTFFVDAAGGDLALNNTVGGGAAIRQNSTPADFIDGATLSYLDRGAVQTSGAPGSGGGGGGGTVLLGPGVGIWAHG